MKSVILQGVTKVFGGKKVLNNLNLRIEGGQFVALLGPSGCGKTTILRIIAGLEEPDEGRVFIDAEEITHTPAYKRKINTVFQQQGLFPHLTVFENIAYGLEIKGLAKDEIKSKVQQQIKKINLLGLENKYPETLSGGQKQRVALARSLVMEPDILLFDEPLSALDIRLKERMLIECSNLQKSLKTTFIYITHDRQEALTVADKIIVMGFEGVVEQIGSPQEIYQRPNNKFVANFVGEVNILAGSIAHEQRETIFFDTEVGILKVNQENGPESLGVTGKFFASIRPELIHLDKDKNLVYKNIIEGYIQNAIFSGFFMQYHVQVGEEVSLLVFEDNFSFKQGDKVFVHIHQEDILILED